ncbi:MAG: retroviral-like aspartic protease family protein [Alphaproteobacteria bacterium]|nr:retroviral-like aspartic protease family protein [Alphaproteobacteria bacterium]
MHRFASFVVALAVLTGPARAARTPDFFAPRAGMNADTALYLDAWSGQKTAVERLRARLKRAPAPTNAYDDRSFLCDFEYHTAQYARSIADCKKAIALNAHGGDANTLAIVKLVADQPLPRAHGSARLPVTKGVHVPVTAGTYQGMAIADTGAQVSVMMQSVAKAADVKLLGASRHVDSVTAPVSGQIGLIPEVKLGDAIVKNIPVLVLPDAQLTITAGKETISLPFILSLYALADFGRIAWLDHDKWLALGSAAPHVFPGAVPMLWHPNGIAVPLQGPCGRWAAQFDSGADISYLYDNAVSLLSAADRTGIVKAKRKIGGVGGVVEQEIRRVPKAELTLAGQPLRLKNLDIAAEPKTGEAARLGEDVLASYSAVVFDFRTMTFSISP